MSPHPRKGSHSPTDAITLPAAALSDEQLEALATCARGISLRFEKWEIVNALLLTGFVERNLAGVVLVTAEGRDYLQTRGISAAGLVSPVRHSHQHDVCERDPEPKNRNRYSD
jgi:hypothetical protein